MLAKGRAALMVLWLVTATGIFVLQGCGEAEGADSTREAQVGKTTITQAEIENRIAVESAYSNDSLPHHTALAALINDALEWEVADSLGLVPDSMQVRAFIEHVETTTRAPEVLARVKQVFGADTAAYIRQYLEPKIVASTLRGYQAYDTAIQSEGRGRIEKAYALVAEGSSFAEAAGMVDGSAEIDTLLRTDTVEGTPGADLVRLAETLQPGKLFDQVLETAHVYFIVRLSGRDEKRLIVEQLFISKERYEDWLHRVARDLPISIRDKNVEAAIRKDHSTLWWLEKNPGG